MVKINKGKGPIVLTKATEFRLDDLLGEITPENQHRECPTGPRMGNEAW